MVEDLSLRITLVAPPAGVAFAVQLGRDRLLPPVEVTPEALSFAFVLQLVPGGRTGSPVLRGPAAQGPPTARFVYIGVGQRAGDSASCWDRRVKVPLGGITTAVLAAWRAASPARLEAQIAGSGRDGEPVCATVPLLGGGWQVRPAPG
jgi:hypothetical protein